MSTRTVLVARPALTAVAAAVALWVAGCDSAGTASAGAPSGQLPATGAATVGGAGDGAAASSTGPSASAPAATAAPRATASEGLEVEHLTPSGLLPLWPFPTAAAVRQWQAAYRSRGSQPWHLDPGRTALAFSSGYLRYPEIDRITSRSVKGGHAHIGVGWAVTGASRTHTAAVLHLIRVGSGPDRPWAVVGSDDTRVTIDAPRYGSTVTTPLRVSGRITGVDEDLRVLVLARTAPGPLYSSPGISAGGERTPWATTVTFRAAHAAVLTIAVSTGGHVKRVESFAVTGVRAS